MSISIEQLHRRVQVLEAVNQTLTSPALKIKSSRDEIRAMVKARPELMDAQAFWAIDISLKEAEEKRLKELVQLIKNFRAHLTEIQAGR